MHREVTRINVPLADVNAENASIRDRLDEAIKNVIDKGNFVGGECLERFESRWAKYCGAKYAVGVSSGTDGLYLVCKYYREELMYDTALVPGLTFWATAEAALKAGLKVGVSDVDARTGCLPIGALDGYDDEHTVIIPVHLYGYPSDVMLPWKNYKWLEDSSHAHGHKIRGHVAVFSHYPTKNLGALGQAGTVVTNDEYLYRWLLSARHHSELHGQRFVHGGVSGNNRLDEIQAAVLDVKLDYLDVWNKNRRKAAALYTKLLANLSGIITPIDHPKHVYHIYTVNVAYAEGRDDLAQALKGAGIATGLRYSTPIHKQPGYLRTLESGQSGPYLPRADSWCKDLLNLPMYSTISDETVEYVCNQIRRWVGKG